MKTQIVVLVNQLLNPTNYKRFNVGFKDKKIDLIFWSLTPLLNKKVFIYLIDVNIENGPYSYVKRTHNKKYMRKFDVKKIKIRKIYRYNNDNVYAITIDYDKF